MIELINHSQCKQTIICELLSYKFSTVYNRNELLSIQSLNFNVTFTFTIMKIELKLMKQEKLYSLEQTFYMIYISMKNARNKC